jgi:uncharacterized Zn ribbon protein
MSDVALNRDTCYHCDRPIRWKRSDEVCRKCHDKWGEPENTTQTDDDDEENSDGVIIDAGDAVVRTTETISCPNCPGWNLLKAKDNGYFCRNCHEEFTESEVDT